MTTWSLEHDGHVAIRLHIDGHRASLERLFDLDGTDSRLAQVDGLATLETDRGLYEADGLRLVHHEQSGLSGVLEWESGDGSARLRSQWTLCPQTGVLTRRDALRNASAQPWRLRRCLMRFGVASGRYEAYHQASRWSRENQGQWTPVSAGTLELNHPPGRTTLDSTPMLGLRRLGEAGALFHVVPCGDWIIRVSTTTVANLLPLVTLELGLTDRHLDLELPAGGELLLPELLITAMPATGPAEAAPRLHRYVVARDGGGLRSYVPVIYNTWFDQFEFLDVPRLRGQFAAARQVGCEAFVIDAGWYGEGGPNWFGQAGDWREKRGAAFDGHMREFADEVRAAGLGFGLWMEPERFGAGVPIRREHPEWFVGPAEGLARMDLEQPDAWEWMRREIARLITTYQLAWMKIDFNFELGHDPRRGGQSGYHARLIDLIRRIRRDHPDTFLEGCASGGLRSDLTSLSIFDCHFVSDTVDPIDVLRIGQGALLRLPPGRLGRWAVLRSVGPRVVHYGRPASAAPDTIVAPCGATWDPAQSVDVDFACRVALPGAFGISGDLSGLPDAARRRIAWHVAFFKQWRQMIARASAHLLTPVESIDQRRDWTAIQLLDHDAGSALLFAYRLADAGPLRRFWPRGLEPRAAYQVNLEEVESQAASAGSAPTTRTGAELMRDGISVSCPASFRAAMVSLRRVGG